MLVSILYDPLLFGIPSTDQFIPYDANAVMIAIKLQILNVFEAAGVEPYSPGCPTTVTVEASFYEKESPLSFLRRVACFVKDGEQFSDQLGRSILRLLYSGAFNISFDMGLYRKDTLPLLGGQVPETKMAIVRLRPPHSVYLHGARYVASLTVTAEVASMIQQTTVRVDDVKNGLTAAQTLIEAFIKALPEPAKPVVQDLFQRGLCYLPTDENLLPADPHRVEGTTPGQDLMLQFPANEDVALDQRIGPAVRSYLRFLETLRTRGRLANAIKIAQDLLTHLKKHQVLRSEWQWTLQTLISQCYLDGKQYAKAAEALGETLELCDKKEKLKRNKDMGVWFHDGREYKRAIEAFRTFLSIQTSGSGEGATAAEVKEVKLRLAGAMYMSGELTEQSAIEMVQNTLQGDMSNDVGISWMVRFYTGRRLASDALSWAVQLLIRNHSSPDTWRYNELAGWVMRSFGTNITMDTLMQLLRTTNAGPDMASAIGHLALVAKDNGLIDIAKGLYEWCCDISPVPSLILNKAHVYETANNPLQSLKTLQNAFLGPLKDTVVRGVSCAEIGRLLGDLRNVDGRYPIPKDICLKRLNKRRPCLRVIAGTDKVRTYETAEEAQTVPRTNFPKAPFNQRGSVTYTETELFILGMFFTTCKDLYVLGLFDKLIDIIPLIVIVRENASLHLTLIRNEAAYFSTVCLIMQHHDSRLANEPAITCDDILYVVGDSHTFAPAWQVIPLNGKKVLLHTAIVTGLKIWHLRDESEFFPKKTFETILQKIPAKSPVMFMIGEIDCREGVPRSVERGIYPTVARAVETLCEIYANVLLQVRQKYKFGTIYVHAPPAGLEMTRTYVLAMQAQLPTTLAPLASKGIYYVNPELLEKDAAGKMVVKPEYVLDYMHLSPAYVPLALPSALEEAALAQASSGSVGSPTGVQKEALPSVSCVEELPSDDDDDGPPPAEAVD